MATNTLKTLITIWQIIRLKQLVKRWKALNLKRKLALSDGGKPILPGRFAVYVGEERKRFLVPTKFLNLPIFLHLLKLSEEEYGFKYNQGITLPCKVDFFEEVLKFMKEDEKKYGNLQVNEFLNTITEMGSYSFSPKDSPLHHSFMHLLLKTQV